MNKQFDVIIAGGSFSGAAAAKRLVDSGLKTLVVERFGLPRHKPCSGIVSPRGHRFLIENFGPLPEEALHEPRTCRGVTFHYPSRLSMPMDFHHGPTPHLHRKYSDHWALKASGAEVYDGTRLTGFEDAGNHVDVTVRRGGETETLRARYLIGADGPNSSVVRCLYPGYRNTIPWFTVKQFFHRIIESPLDEEYFHFWVHPYLGYYTWSHRRDDGQIVGVGYEAGDNLEERHDRVIAYLREMHGVRLEPAEDREGSVNNFGLSLTNRYVFGRGNVLVTGQASGFLNMIAEGMSCALHSGAIAGEAVVEAIRFNEPVQKVYRRMVSSEVRRCSDQWNPFKILFSNPHEADFMGTLGKHPAAERLQIARDIISFLKPWGRYKWGRKILWQALVRKIRDGYAPSRWM